MDVDKNTTIAGSVAKKKAKKLTEGEQIASKINK